LKAKIIVFNQSHFAPADGIRSRQRPNSNAFMFNITVVKKELNTAEQCENIILSFSNISEARIGKLNTLRGSAACGSSFSSSELKFSGFLCDVVSLSHGCGGVVVHFASVH